MIYKNINPKISVEQNMKSPNIFLEKQIFRTPKYLKLSKSHALKYYTSSLPVLITPCEQYVTISLYGEKHITITISYDIKE